MTNSHTPAPRPCTLWGSTFDAKVCTKIMARFSGSGEHKGKFCLQVHGQDGCPPLVETPLAGKNERSVFSEAITALHNALHPWLDVQDAVEKGLIESGKRYVYIMDDGSMHHTYRFEHPLIKGFIPPSWLPCPSRDPEKIKAHADQATADRLRFACVKTAEGV